jgi:hypothetical protein
VPGAREASRTQPTMFDASMANAVLFLPFEPYVFFVSFVFP